MMKFLRLALAVAVLISLGLASSTTYVQAASLGYCDSVARDYARRNSSGGAISGAVRGGVRGGITGRVLGGKKGAKKGRRIGGTIGTIRGGSQRAASFNYLYDQAYHRCMRG